MPDNALDLSGLTALPTKLDQYQREDGDYLGRGVRSARRVFGDQLPAVLAKLAVLLVQPDAVAARSVERCLAYTAGREFVVLAAVPVTLTVPIARRLWRFQFNAKTDASREIGEGVYCRGPSLLLAFRHPGTADPLHVSRHMTLLKGASDPKKRGAGTLRSELNAPTRIVRAVHSPDDPLDILRETAVLLDGAGLDEFFTRMATSLRRGTPYDCRADIAAAYAATAPHDINLDRACRRLRERVDRAAAEGADAHAVRRVREVIRRVRQGPTGLDWSVFGDDLTALAIDRYDWDPLMVASSLVEYETPGVPKLIPSLSSPSQ